MNIFTSMSYLDRLLAEKNSISTHDINYFNNMNRNLDSLIEKRNSLGDEIFGRLENRIKNYVSDNFYIQRIDNNFIILPLLINELFFVTHIVKHIPFIKMDFKNGIITMEFKDNLSFIEGDLPEKFYCLFKRLSHVFNLKIMK